jgi:hypothetical protein
MKLNRTFFEKFLLRHRRILVALLGATVVWVFASNLTGTTSVVLVSSPLPAGSTISADSMSMVEVRGVLPDGFIRDISQVQGLFTNQNLSPGTLLLSSHLSTNQNSLNKFVASLPLEAGDTSTYPPGSSVRVWAISDEGAFLISENAVVLSTQESVGANNRVTLAFDEASEFRLMQAFAIRLVLNQV